MERLIKLVKPGGWIQIVDAELPTSPIEENDMPSMKIFKTIGAFLKGAGFNPTAGKQAFEMLEKAGGLKSMGRKDLPGKLGKGAPNAELEAIGYEELTGVVEAISPGLKNVPSPPMSSEEFEKLLPLALEEARTQGVQMLWHGAWGQRM